MPLRELFWAGQEIYLSEVYKPIIIGTAIFLPAIMALFIFGFWRRYRLWKMGQPENRKENWPIRLRTTLAVTLANLRILKAKELFPGLMHSLIFWGTALIFWGKIIRLFSLTGLTRPPQSIFLYASLIAELGAGLILIGGGMAVFRRYVRKHPRLDTKPEDTLVFIWAFFLILTGFMVKGFRIALSDISPTDWAMWSPLGYHLSNVFPTFATGIKNEILVWHRALIHAIPAFIFMGYIWVIRSRLQHVFLSPLNVFFRSLKPKGSLTPIDFEKTEVFGAAKIEDFTWKQLLDLDACTRCGRCQDACPAYFSGKALNPKQVIQDLKTHLYEVYPIPLAKNPVESRPDMISDVISEEVIWDCTTCRACLQECPIYVEHIDKIVDMRRILVMERGQLPESAKEVLKSLETRAHPWSGAVATRTDWTESLEIKVLQEDRNIDVLYWVGCTAALDERNMKVSAATAKILKAAGVNFGILGAEESCCGDPARRMGNEYLFQTICEKNVELLNSYDVKKILASCPHCFNTLKNEYSQFNGNFQVIHHSQFISDLIRDGKIKPGKLDTNKVIAYHDACYLGRYNDIYRAPRDILRSIGSVKSAELAHSGSRSFCCGGGGGHMWMEDDPSTRVSVRRVEEVIKAKADILATACPYCLSMVEDGLKTKEAEESIKAMDLSEIIVQALNLNYS